ncbi:TPA: hypothetical protein HA231_01710, partial [Candidatus Woesearchaeota archaeon]|nr:hypothetical protein [Candidatus Woesearchaeota archaeon]
CQIYDNRRLEKREQQSKSQQGGGIAVDLSLMEEKKALISGKGFFASTIFSRIKTIYFIWLAIDIVFPGNPVQIAQSMALLSAQYFREVHYTPPNETSRVAAFIHSLVPRPVATKEYGT